MSNYDHDETLMRCDGCKKPSMYLTDVCGYEFCDDCIEEQAENDRIRREYEESQI